MHWYQIFALDSTVVEEKNVKLAWRIPNYCNVSSNRNNIIKLTHYDETEKRAHDSQIVRAKENLKLSHGRPSYSQSSGTSYSQACSRTYNNKHHVSEFTLTVSLLRITLNAPIATKVVCFSRLLKCLRSFYGKQCGPRSDCSYRNRGAVCSWSTLFASILFSLVILGTYLQQTTSADDIFRCSFFLSALRINSPIMHVK